MTLGRAARLDVGHVIERTVSTTAAIARPLLLPALVLIGGATFVSQFLAGYNPADPTAVFSSPAYWLAVLATSIVGVLGQAIITAAALDHLCRRRADVRASFATALDLLLPVFGFYLLGLLMIVAGLVLLVVPGVVVALALTVGLPAMLEERLGVVAAMSRSRDLTRDSRLRILALILIGAMIYAGASALLGAPVAIAGEQSGIPRAALLVIDAVLATLGALLTGAFTAALYAELRLVKEGPSGAALTGVFE